MTIEECKLETLDHIEKVRHYIKLCIDKLATRGIFHDHTKLESPEVEVFTEYTPKLATAVYNSPEYKEFLASMGTALEHHYANNRHHPEYFEKGIDDMNLIDIIEMICDWKASTKRTANGNLLTSIEHNAKRFNINDQLKNILVNTAKLFDDIDHLG